MIRIYLLETSNKENPQGKEYRVAVSDAVDMTFSPNCHRNNCPDCESGLKNLKRVFNNQRKFRTKTEAMDKVAQINDIAGYDFETVELSLDMEF